MKRLTTYFLALVTIGLLMVQANDPQDGYAIVHSDTIYGKIQINFEVGSIVVKQDSINRMFVSGIKRVTLLNKKRETYLLVNASHEPRFHELLVDGEHPLLAYDQRFFTLVDGQLVLLENEKSLYGIFGKRQVKEYTFIRNVDISKRSGLIDVFLKFNT